MNRKKTMNKGFLVLLMLLVMMFAFATTANAAEYSGTAKGTKWSVNTETGVLSIDVDGPMGSWTQGSQPWYKYRSYIRSIEFKNATSKITNYAFSDLVALEIIEIPNSVEEIGDRAFLNCSAATDLYIPISVGTWGGYVFEQCRSINYIYTENQANISMSAPIWDSSVGSSAEGGVELQIESKAIGQYAFYGLSTVTNVKLPTTLTGINSYAFYGFTSPFSLNLMSATSIGEYAFYHATGVTSISLPVATEVGQHAFDGCTGALEINIPVATNIGAYAFANCTSAETITVGSSDTVTYGASAFAGDRAVTSMYLGNINFTDGCSALNEVGATNGVTITLGKEITSIGAHLRPSYIGTTGNLSIELEKDSKLATVEASAFKDNAMVVSVDLSNRDGAVSYGAYAFDGCSHLTSFVSNSGAATLTTNSFANLDHLEYLDWKATSTNLGWAPADITVTRNLSAATLSGSQNDNFSASATSVTSSDGINLGGGITSKRVSSVNFGGATAATTMPASGTATLSYSFSGENTASHPFFNMGRSTTNGTTVVFSGNAGAIPAYMFTSGIQMVEVNSGNQSVNPETGVATYSTAYDTSYIYSPGSGTMPYSVGDRTYIASGNWITSSWTFSIPYFQSSISNTLTYNVSTGTKGSYNTNIKINSLNSRSENLSQIGSNVLGSINYELTTTTSKVSTPTVTNRTLSCNTGSTILRSNASNALWTALTNSYNNNNNYDSITYSFEIDATSYSVNSTNATLYQGVYIGAGPNVGSINTWIWTPNNLASETAIITSNMTGYYYYYGWLSNTLATKAIKASLTGDSSYIESVSKTGTTTTASSSKSETVASSSKTTNSYLRATSNVNDSATLINLSVTALNANVNQFAFSGDNTVSNVYLASAISTVGANAFYTKAVGGQMYIYGHTNSDPIASQSGISTNNSYTIHWEPSLRDYGMFVAAYDVGTHAKAYLYQTVGDHYLINISGTGSTSNYDSVARPEWFALYGTKITELVVDDTITSIGNYMFYGHTGLSTVTVGDGLTTIGVHAFDGDTTLTSVPAGAGLTTIGDQAFANTGIKEAVIPETITALGSAIFSGSPVETIDYYAVSAYAVSPATKPFSGIGGAGKTLTITIKDNVTTVPSHMFYGCNATSVTIGTNVATIGSGAFSGMPYAEINVISDNTHFKRSGTGNGDLYSIDDTTLITYLASHQEKAYTLPVTTSVIAAGAFYGHPKIEQVSFGANITAVGDNAFVDAQNLRTISISDFMDEASFEIEVETGENWSGSADVIYSGLDWDIGSIPGQMTARLYSDGSLIITGTGAMKNWASANSVEWAAKRASIISVTFNGEITSIGSYAFYGAENLGDVELPSTLTTLGQYAFYGCDMLNDVTIPDGVKTIETYTFGNCGHLGFVDVGNGVTTIEPFAFAGCRNGQYVSIGGNVKVIKANAFKGCNYLTVLMVGKSSTADFDEAVGVPEAATTGAADLFRICWLKDIKSGNVLHRYPGNVGAAAKVENLRSATATRSDLWAYGYDTDGDDAIDYLHFVGNSGMDNFEEPESAYWHDIRNTLTSVRVDDDVTTIGKNAFINCPHLRFARIGLECNTIGDFAFKNAPELRELYCDARNLVSMPTQASEIFVNSGSDEGFSVYFEDHVQNIPQNMFYGCTNLSNITLGEGVRAIGVGAFAEISKLQTLYIKSTTINTTTGNTFTNAGSLSPTGGFDVEIAANVTVIPSSIFNATNGAPYVLSVVADSGSKLTTIYGSAFLGCSRLSTASFANCTLLTQVQENAFKDCTRLVTADFSNCVSLQSFGSSAFEQCVALASFNIDNCEALRSFGTRSHYRCAAIRELVLPRSVVQVDSQCFDGWTNEQTIYVLGKTSTSGFTSGCGSQWAGNGTQADVVVVWSTVSWDMTDTEAINPETSLPYPANTVMAYYCPNINAYANQNPHLFISGAGPIKDYTNNDNHWNDLGTNYAPQVTNIVISDSVTRVGNYAFAGMTNARSLRIGRNTREVGKFAFLGDAAIPEVDFTIAAANIQTIAEGAFKDCSGISSVNLSGCDALTAINADAFKNLSGSSNIYVSSDYWYDYLTFNASGRIDSTYGTTNNTTIVLVRVYFTQNLASKGAMQGDDIVWHVETASAGGATTFKWFFAEKGAEPGEWTQISSSMQGYRIVSTENSSDLYMDGSIVTLDKSGYYFYCQADNPYYGAKSNIATLAVYSSAITPTLNVYDKNGNPLDSNTWTQGPLTISISAGEEAEAQGASYQYKLKASGSWRNTESRMYYDTQGIVTMYVRAIVNGDGNTASPSVKYVLKVDNTAPMVTSIEADPEVGATDSVTLTATATDNISGVNTIGWYKAAEDRSGSNVKGYVPVLEDTDMYTMVIEVKEFVDDDNDGTYKENFYRTQYNGQNASVLESETYAVTGNMADDVTDAGTLANLEAAQNAIKTPGNSAGTIARFKLYEVHVGDNENDYEISASDKGVIILPVPTGTDSTGAEVHYVNYNGSGKVTENNVLVYTFNNNGVLTPITRFNLTSDGTGIVIPISRFGQYLIAEKAPIELP